MKQQNDSLWYLGVESTLESVLSVDRLNFWHTAMSCRLNMLLEYIYSGLFNVSWDITGFALLVFSLYCCRLFHTVVFYKDRTKKLFVKFKTISEFPSQFIRIWVSQLPEPLVRLERLDIISTFTGTEVQDGNNGLPVTHGLMPDLEKSNTQGRPLRRTRWDSRILEADFQRTRKLKNC